jgi:hypothetical protein
MQRYFYLTGLAAGGYFDHYGAAAEYVCLPLDPDVHTGSQRLSNVPTFIYGAEYEDSYFHVKPNGDVPCAVCMPKQARAVIMIAGKSKCYPGWKLEYYGNLASGYLTHKAATQYVCVDSNPQMFDGGNANRNGKLFYAVEAECGSLRCPPYKEHVTLSCVVCSK